MTHFLDEFLNEYGGEVSRGLASNLGVRKKTAHNILPEVVPLVLGGLKRQMETRGGADRVDHILNKYGKDDVLDRIQDEMASRSRHSQPDPRLGGLLGDSGVQATDLISNKMNLGRDLAQKIIPMLAPIILGALTRKRDRGGMGSQGIASLLDQDGDGSILDDVAGFIMGGQGGPGGGSSQGLGSLIGTLFKKRR